jgi:hypothetical protein
MRTMIVALVIGCYLLHYVLLSVLWEIWFGERRENNPDAPQTLRYAARWTLLFPLAPLAVLILFAVLTWWGLAWLVRAACQGKETRA